MARMVVLSTEVFAAIWARRQAGEQSEDDILARVLNAVPAPDAEADQIAADQPGNRDGLPEGFEAFRHHEGKTYSARVEGIYWRRLDNGRTFRTLNSLNTSILGRHESVWSGSWMYIAPDGSHRSIAELRSGWITVPRTE